MDRKKSPYKISFFSLSFSCFTDFCLVAFLRIDILSDFRPSLLSKNVRIKLVY